jgi:F-type H+/Na+-transporting ATPase subunit alpha
VSRVGGNAQVKAMKRVAGRLRIELAQYRELEAFAQFASDLDAATRRQLDYGARLVEILKQPQYEPVPVEKQILVIYAATAGYLAAVPVAAIGQYERELLVFFDAEHKDLLQHIAETGSMVDGIKEKIDAALKRFNDTFTVEEA